MGSSLKRWWLWLLMCVACCGGCVNKVIVYKIDHEYATGDPQFVRSMGNLLGPAFKGGNKIVTLRNGQEIFPAMLAAIRGAQHSINLETYIYWSGRIGRDFTDALCERARAGVHVHVLIDWLGSARIDPNYIKEMRACGVEVVAYHPWHWFDPSTIRTLDNRTHRKVMVVDGRIGFTGGVGIADEWDGHAQDANHWRDNQYVVEGPIVAELQSVFLDNWMQSTGEVLQSADYFPALPKAGDQLAQTFKSSFKGGSESMQLMFLMSLTAATKDIRIQSAYFVPGRETTVALLAARQRGVRIQIIVPGGKIDQKLVRRASRATWGPLLKEGVEIYEYQPTMMHCKLMVTDGLWVSIGSSNFDNRSFRLNDEANLNVLDAAFARAQEKIFDEDRSHARRITFEAWARRPLNERIMEGLANLMSWEL